MEESLKIQWFPGHMSKTLREIDENLKLVNAVIYCLDARVPLSSLNPSIDKKLGEKPVIIVLNKADLADENATKRAVKFFEEKGKTVIVSSAINNASKGAILKALKTAFAEKQKTYAKRGVNGVFRAMVIGVPNTGKSTIINLLAGAKKATTGDKAGVTRQTNWIKVDENIEIMDTPGTLWPKFEHFETGRNLAMVGSIKDDILDVSELGFYSIKHLIDIAPKKIIERYGLKLAESEIDELETIEVYDQICAKRGWILKKNEMDYERAGKGILDDFRSGRMGKITLDKI